jgi:hypothetical protein
VSDFVAGLVARAAGLAPPAAAPAPRLPLLDVAEPAEAPARSDEVAIPAEKRGVEVPLHHSENRSTEPKTAPAEPKPAEAVVQRAAADPEPVRERRRKLDAPTEAVAEAIALPREQPETRSPHEPSPSRIEREERVVIERLEAPPRSQVASASAPDASHLQPVAATAAPAPAPLPRAPAAAVVSPRPAPDPVPAELAGHASDTKQAHERIAAPRVVETASAERSTVPPEIEQPAASRPEQVRREQIPVAAAPLPPPLPEPQIVRPPEPAIEVRIGRVEVRSPPLPPELPYPAAPPLAPPRSLDDLVLARRHLDRSWY